MTDIFGGEDAGPSRPGQVIRLNPKTRLRQLDRLTWGLLPHDTENPDTAPRPIHARAETVADLPTFASAFRNRRAVVPVGEYFQRRTIGKQKQRFAISRKDGHPMAIAGLWESFVSPDREVIRTYCIITIEATGAVAEIHDRMPVMLDMDDLPLWLGEVRGDPDTLLRPPADGVLMARAIGGH